MTVRLIIALIVTIGFLPIGAFAQTPEDFLLEVVKTDFQGDPSPRIGRVFFSEEAKQAEYQKALDLSNPVPEAYALDMDPLVIVRDWKIASHHGLGTSTICLVVQFDVLARTTGQGLPSWKKDQSRDINVLGSSQLELVDYCATEVNGKWMLIDPPLPRVERSVMVNALQEALSGAEKRIKEVKTNDPRARKNMTVIRDSLARQLAVLVSL